MTRWLIGIFSAFLLFLLFIGFTTLTPTGVKAGLYLIQKTLPGKLSYDTVQGTPLTTLSLTHVSYESKNMLLTIANLRLRWQLFYLFMGKLRIKYIDASQVNLLLAAKTDDTSTFLKTLKKLTALEIEIDEGRFHDIQIVPAKNKLPWQLKTLHIHRVLLGPVFRGMIHTSVLYPYPTQLTLEIAGIWHDYRFKLMAQGKHFFLQLRGEGDKKQIHVYTQESNFLQGNLLADAQFNFSPTLSWQVFVKGEHLHLNKLDSRLPTSLSTDIHTTGHMQNGAPYFAMNSTLQTPGGTLHIQGTRGDIWQMQWKIMINKLSAFFTDYQGQLAGMGTIAGTLSEPVITGKLQGDHLHLLGLQLATLQSQWLIDAGFHQASQLIINATQLQWRTYHFPTWQFNAALSQNATSLTLTTPHFNMRLAGQLLNREWRGTLNHFHLQIPSFPQWQFSKGTIDLALPGSMENTNALRLHATGYLSAHNFFEMNVLLPEFSLMKNFFATQPIVGDIHLAHTHFETAEGLLPQGVHLAGLLNTHLTVHGTLKNPLIDGKIELSPGNLDIPNLQLSLTDLHANIHADTTLIQYEVTAKSHQQPVSIRGRTQYTEPDYPTTFTLQGNNILVMNTTEYVIYASPRLAVTIHGHEVDVTGEALLPQGLFQPIDLHHALALPEDAVFVGKDAQKNSPWRLRATITLMAGNNIQLQSHGLAGLLTGKVVVSIVPGQPNTASGTIGILNGTYTIHQHTLSLAPGSHIVYNASPLKNPNLDIQAFRTVTATEINGENTAPQTLQVGLNIGGNLHQPQVTLYSKPVNLSQSDILSYLLFGQPTNANTPDNVNALLQAVNNLHLGGAEYRPGGVKDQIIQGLGLGEYGLETPDTLDAIGTPVGAEDSAFVQGRYISPRLYLRYSSGMIIPINIVQVRYLMGVHWAIQTESSSLGNGVDLLYTIQHP